LIRRHILWSVLLITGFRFVAMNILRKTHKC
jgi:hypothetical protein